MRERIRPGTYHSQAGDLTLYATPPTIRITRAVKRDDESRYYVGSTKTAAGRRTITITRELADEIREHVADMRPTGRVLSSPEGSLLNSGHARARVWIRAISAAGIGLQPYIQDLRHTHASWLIASGVDVLTVKKCLAHESITTTVDTYSHVMSAQQQAAADAIGRMLS